MATQLSQKRAFDPPAAIPDRLYFKIGDVAKICGVETYVLRFWETEFPQLKPNKSGAGQRLYRRRDVELVLEIRRLVHVEGYTLAGARQVLDQAKGRPGPQKVQQIPPPTGGCSRSTARPAVGSARRFAISIAAFGRGFRAAAPRCGCLSNRPRTSGIARTCSSTGFAGSLRTAPSRPAGHRSKSFRIALPRLVSFL